MTVAGAGSAGVERSASPSESARFGHPVERVLVGADWRDVYTEPELARAVAAEVAASEARTVILRYPSRDVFLARSLAATGRQVHPAGSLIYWETTTAAGRPDADVRELAAGTDAHEVLSVIADSFAGYVNHYAANPLIEDGAVTEGYLEWAAGTLEHPTNRVFAIEQDGVIAGVATVDTAAGEGPWDILLAGMAARFQGRGLYLRLLGGVLAAAAADGEDRVMISTQSHNIAVQRAWAKLGFAPTASIDTVHLVAR